jgi:hypothetical protein
MEEAEGEDREIITGPPCETGSGLAEFPTNPESDP